MSNKEDIFSKEKENSRIDSVDIVTSNINGDLKENFNVDKEKIIKQLKASKNVEERVKLFSKWMDKYGLEAIAGIIPAIGDLTPSIISTCYLLSEGIRIGLSRKDCLKVLGYQGMDVLIGSIPLIGDVADFFFKSNKYSAKIFSDHIKKLKKTALEMGITQNEIDNMGKKESNFIKTMDKYVDYNSKKKGEI